MPPKPSPAPELRKHKASGQWYVHLDGRRVYLGKDREAADQARRRILAERLLSGTGTAAAPRDRPLSAGEAVETYLQHSRAVHDQGTHSRVRRALLTLGELYGLRPVGEVDQIALSRVRADLLSQRSARGADREAAPLLSRQYVNRCVKSIQQAWAWLEERRLVPDGAAARLRTVQALREGQGGREAEAPGAVAAGDVARTLPHLSPVVAAMVAVQLATGMRPGEVCRMRPRDLSRSPAEPVALPGKRRPVCAVDVSGVTIWLYVPATHKTRHRGKDRIVALGPKAQAALAPLLAGLGPEEYVFRTVAGPRFETGSYEQAVSQAVARANRTADPPIPHWTPNQLRHLAATEIRDAFSHDDAGAVLGHAQPDTTAIYSEAAVNKAAAVAARIG